MSEYKQEMVSEDCTDCPAYNSHGVTCDQVYLQQHLGCCPICKKCDLIEDIGECLNLDPKISCGPHEHNGDMHPNVCYVIRKV